jgi:hypothetical protein
MSVTRGGPVRGAAAHVWLGSRKVFGANAERFYGLNPPQ